VERETAAYGVGEFSDISEEEQQYLAGIAGFAR
jgi:hypothetical protein